jgi:hypothetical protein
MNHLLDLPKIKLAYEQSIKCIYGVSEEGIQINPLNKKGNLGVKINGWSSSG